MIFRGQIGTTALKKPDLLLAVGKDALADRNVAAVILQTVVLDDFAT